MAYLILIYFIDRISTRSMGRRGVNQWKLTPIFCAHLDGWCTLTETINVNKNFQHKNAQNAHYLSNQLNCQLTCTEQLAKFWPSIKIKNQNSFLLQTPVIGLCIRWPVLFNILHGLWFIWYLLITFLLSRCLSIYLSISNSLQHNSEETMRRNNKVKLRDNEAINTHTIAMAHNRIHKITLSTVSNCRY